MERNALINKSKKVNRLLFLLFLVSIVMSVVDLWVDLEAGLTLHFYAELLVFIILLIICYLVVRKKNELDDFSISALSEKIESLDDEKRRNELLSRSLYERILQQFKHWDFTAAEIEVASLLIKGFSIKEISELRGSVDKTVREQASAIYRKAGIHSRAELAAFFIEDIL
jgi:DNA-binding CsgD family transcriptional regulator